MTKKFNYNFINKTIEGSKSAIEKANKGIDPEYSELTTMLMEHPDFTVSVKAIQKKEGKKSYRKLTLSRMEEYIKTQYSDKEELNKKLIEFTSIQKIAKTKGALYPLTKKWFLFTYKEFKENAASEIESLMEQEALAAAEAQLDALEDEADEMLDEYEESAA